MVTTVPPPRVPSAFPALRSVRPKTPFPGGLRKRWRDAEGRIYEWDYMHGAVEMYDAQGRHLGEFDSATGEQLKQASSLRTIKP